MYNLLTFSEVLPAFTCAIALDHLLSISLRIIILISVPRVYFLIGIFEGLDDVFFTSIVVHNFHWKYISLKYN